VIARLLRDAEHYLSALHGSVARHDNLAAQFVAIAAMFLLAGVAHLLAQPPLLALAAVALGVLRLARVGAGR